MIEKLFPDAEDALAKMTVEKYEEAKRGYIASYREYKPGGFLSPGYYENRPDVGEAKWNRRYPNGYNDWKMFECESFNGGAQNMMLAKINELVESVNRLSAANPTL